MESLVLYAAVVKNTTILAEYRDSKSGDLYLVAARCLEDIPPFHSKFSHTTNNRMFICLIEGVFIYCAVMDEALSKATAVMFLEHVRDAFKVLLQQRDVHINTLTSYSLHHDMDPFFKHLALPLVGMPQREKIRLQEEAFHRQNQNNTENEYDVSSPSAVAPLKEMSDEDFDLQTEHKPMSSCSHPRPPSIPFFGKLKRSKKKTRNYKKGVINSPSGSCEALNSGKALEVMVDNNSLCDQVQTHRPDWQTPQDTFRRLVKWCVFVDLIICLGFLVIWLIVCHGVNCVKRN